MNRMDAKSDYLAGGGTPSNIQNLTLPGIVRYTRRLGARSVNGTALAATAIAAVFKQYNSTPTHTCTDHGLAVPLVLVRAGIVGVPQVCSLLLGR